MKNDGISQSEPRKIQLDEIKICQLTAVLEKMWPDVGGSGPELRVVAPQPEPESRNLRVTIVDRKKRRDQLNALLDEAWGPVQNETPKPRVDRVMVDRLKGMIRATWPDEFGASRKVVRFPRTMKRGAKKRTGPCAEIVQLRCGRSDYSANERSVFDTFARTESARYAAAVVEYFRLPVDEAGGCRRRGMTPAEFLRDLDRQGI
jgi:hypothetical protein